MALQLFNVLGREKQPFEALTEGQVSMYVCGPTVYDDAHIGHARTYVSFDVMVRWLRHSAWDVLYVQNLTDVGHLLDSGEDRILRKARQLQAGPMQVVETYTRSYFADMDALGVQRPDISPRASAHVPEQIEMIETLIRSGNAYDVAGNVYFDVTSHVGYGKLSNRVLEEQEAGSREAVRDEKRHPADFALWKRAEPEHILRWNSPWGVGFPGWHIECSAMARKYLGPTFDIHGGGIDNIYPHNENEIAQSECANDADFARYWLLVGSLMVLDEEGIPVKMSKSLGNFITVRDMLTRARPEALRAFVLGAHYSNPVTWSEDALAAAAAGQERLQGALRQTRQRMNNAVEGDGGNAFLPRLERARADFAAAMDDDFNAPRALAVLHDLTREVNTLLNSPAQPGLSTLAAIEALYSDLGAAVLGVVTSAKQEGGDGRREGDLVEMLIALRAEARVNRDYATSDRIRDELAGLGFVLEDGPGGTVWRREGA
ncbi:MAG: cysteine--tRNA ligase [Anaerolineaceae bacterium]|nr:cysteine--tRNA ligase [Anaerolineaceae bacterium]